MGFMGMEECRTCKGIGYVPDIEDIEIDAILHQKPAPLPEEIIEPAIPSVTPRKENDGSAKDKAPKKRNAAKEKTS